ncbi:MAG: replicative DNA helicase [Ignavibacteria bacterium]|nr:replicative DNA helicase [Ignavibacteria bacterium]
MSRFLERNMTMPKQKKDSKYFDNVLNEDFDFGDIKMPPNAVDIEEKILCAILLDNQIYYEIAQVLDDKHFYKAANGEVFKAMKNLIIKNEPVDAASLKQELTRMGKLTQIGGVEYIIDLTDKTTTSANAAYYARIVFEKYVLRDLIRISSNLVEKCLDKTANTYSLLEESQKMILNASEFLSKKKVIAVKDDLDNLISELVDRRKDRNPVVGIPTGFDKLDELTTGFQKSELIIIAARPSQGKTALALNIARNAAVDYDKTVGFFSLEMSFRELLFRLIAAEAQVDGHRLKTGRSSHKDWEEVLRTYPRLKKKIYIDDSSSLSILELRAKATRMKNEYGLDILIVDYLQLVKGMENPERRDLEVAYVSRGLKALAKELDIPVVACAQVGRSAEKGGRDKRPQLSDLRESGAIEQDADVVIFIHRPYFGIKYEQLSPEEKEKAQNAEIIIGKQRNGPVGEFELVFKREYARFVNKYEGPEIEIPPEEIEKPPF